MVTSHSQAKGVLSARGYRFPPSLTPEEVDSIQTALDQLLTLAPNPLSKTSLWQRYKQVISIAKRCFSLSLWEWLSIQSNNPYLYGRRVECFYDTLAFIHNAERSLSTRYWYELLEDDPQPATRLAATQTLFADFKRDPLVHKPISEVIVLWCSQPNGIEDMLWTLYVFFGREKPNIEHTPPPTTLSHIKPLSNW